MKVQTRTTIEQKMMPKKWAISYDKKKHNHQTSSRVWGLDQLHNNGLSEKNESFQYNAILAIIRAIIEKL